MLTVTAQAQACVLSIIRAGDIVIDATVGNGHDTRFLADCVGPTGHVYAIDLQQHALDQAAQLLSENNLAQIIWKLGNHAQLPEIIPAEHQGCIAVVMFNLGYLPGGDKSITTTASTTAKAVMMATRMLRPGGLVTIVAYTGHPGGLEETQALEAVLTALCPNLFQTEWFPSDPSKHHPPRLYVIRKLSEDV